MSRQGIKRPTLCLLAALVLLGCDHIPEGDVRSAKAVESSITTTLKDVEELRKQHDTFVASAAGKKLKKYADKERWKDRYPTAKSDLERARTLYAQRVPSILKKDESKDAPKLRAELDRLRSIVKGAREAAEAPRKRYAFLKNALDNAPAIRNAAESDLNAMMAANDALDAKMATVKTDWPAKKGDIDGRLAVAKRLEDQAIAASDIVYAEFGKIPDMSGDLAAFADAAAAIRAKRDERAKLHAALEQRTGELYKSYTKTLVDMRTDCFVTVRRSSWDNDSDWDSENDHVYRQTSIPCDKLDEYEGNEEISSSAVAAIGLSPQESWPAFDDDASYWVEDSDAKFFHKYLLVENGKKTETDWEEVDEDEFFDHENDLGMDILAKPYGLYEDEVMEDAAPPGMAYVGDAKYGTWEQDPHTGQSFWHWYGQYMFFSNLFGPSHYYSRYDYDTWTRSYRGREPYYGGTGGAAVYGTKGSLTSSSPRLSGSRYIRSGGLRSSPASVRNAAFSSRGRGPGGGGK